MHAAAPETHCDLFSSTAAAGSVGVTEAYGRIDGANCGLGANRHDRDPLSSPPRNATLQGLKDSESRFQPLSSVAIGTAATMVGRPDCCSAPSRTYRGT